MSIMAYLPSFSIIAIRIPPCFDPSEKRAPLRISLSVCVTKPPTQPLHHPPDTLSSMPGGTHSDEPPSFWGDVSHLSQTATTRTRHSNHSRTSTHHSSNTDEGVNIESGVAEVL